MSKKNNTTPSTDASASETTTRKTRVQRALTPLEVAAKQQLADAKSLAKITPLIDKLTPNGRNLLVDYLETPIAAPFDTDKTNSADTSAA